MKEKLIEIINQFDELDFCVPPDWWVEHFADHLLASGVTMAAEAPKEIFAEIENCLRIVKVPCINAEGCITPVQAPYWAIDPNDFAELKKKYTETD